MICNNKIIISYKKMKPIREYFPPDFSEEKLKNAPDCKFVECEKDGVLPLNYHSTSIFPEYFKIKGEIYN